MTDSIQQSENISSTDVSQLNSDTTTPQTNSSDQSNRNPTDTAHNNNDTGDTHVTVPIPTDDITVQKHHNPKIEDQRAADAIKHKLKHQSLTEYIISILSVIAILGYCFVVPYILTSIYYITWIKSIESAVCSIALPLIMLSYEYILYKHNHSHLHAWHSFSQRSKQAINNSSKKWIYESYQLLLTTLSVSLWISYTFYLQFYQLPTGQYTYTTTMPNVSLYVQCELFVVFGIGIDLLLRYSIALNRIKFITNIYNMLDILVLTSIVYFGFYYHSILGVADTTYNLYLIGGFLRFLRWRRALLQLDHTVTINGIKMHRLGPFILSTYTARAVLLMGRVSIYLFATAAVIESIEFPCIAVQASGASCNPAFQQFHEVVYFITVTLSTVGYGDIYPATIAGRMIMIGVIIGAVVNVPLLVSELGALADDQTDSTNQPTNQSNNTEQDHSDTTDKTDPVNTNSTEQTDAIKPSNNALSDVQQYNDTDYNKHILYITTTHLSQHISKIYSTDDIQDMCNKLGIEVTKQADPALTLVTHLTAGKR